MTQPPLPSRLWKHGFFFPEKLATWRSCHLIIKLAGTSLGRRHYTHGVDQSWVLGLQEWLNFQFRDFFWTLAIKRVKAIATHSNCLLQTALEVGLLTMNTCLLTGHCFDRILPGHDQTSARFSIFRYFCRTMSLHDLKEKHDMCDIRTDHILFKAASYSFQRTRNGCSIRQIYDPFHITLVFHSLEKCKTHPRGVSPISREISSWLNDAKWLDNWYQLIRLYSGLFRRILSRSMPGAVIARCFWLFWLSLPQVSAKSLWDPTPTNVDPQN